MEKTETSWAEAGLAKPCALAMSLFLHLRPGAPRAAVGAAGGTAGEALLAFGKPEAAPLPLTHCSSQG